MTDIIEHIGASTPKYNMDQFVATFSLDYPTTDAITGHSFNIGGAFPPGYKMLPEIVYSFDGGATWWDTAEYSNPSGFDIEPAITLDFLYNVDTQLLTISGQQTALVNGGDDYNMKFKIGFSLPPDATTYDTYNDFNFFSGPDAYSASLEYLKILDQDVFSYVANADKVTKIDHNLGYVPHVQVYLVDPGLGVNGLKRMNSTLGNTGNPLDYVQIDEGSLYIHTIDRTGSGSPTVTVVYKIYYGNY